MDSHAREAPDHNFVTIHRMFEDQANDKPDQPAILLDANFITYSTLNQKANQLAHFLQTRIARPGAIIAIAFDRSFDMFIAILGILKSGAAYLPLDTHYPDERLKLLLDNSEPQLLITTSNFKSKFKYYSGPILYIDVDQKKILQQSIENPGKNIKAEDLAYVIYTSGSTGLPKGVLIEHQSVTHYIKWFFDYTQCGINQRFDFSSNYIFDMSVTSSITPLALGLQIVICSDDKRSDANEYVTYLRQNKITTIKITPSFFRILLYEVQNNPIALPDLEFIILGGEHLQTIDCKEWLSLYPQHVLFNEYGPTETTVGISQFQVNKNNVYQLGKSVPIGRPCKDVFCCIVGEKEKQLPIGKIGELYIGGICLARGYLNQTELTKDKFITYFINGMAKRMYKSGDLCRLLADGNIEYIGRRDDQVKIRGYRIEPAEIESCLRSYPLINEASVVARESYTNDMQLIAYYTLHNEFKFPTLNELRLYLLTYLPEYMLPSAFVQIKQIQLAANGKLNKKELPNSEKHHLELGLKPQSDLEKMLEVIWCEAFGKDQINRDANFFELGGHSLIAARIISKIQTLTGKNIHTKDIYEASTIADLAKLIVNRTHIHLHQESHPILNISKFIPLSDFQFMFWMSNIFEPKTKKINIFGRRRVAGKIDIAKLYKAFEQVFAINEIFSYQISKFMPAQYQSSKLQFHIEEKDLTNLSLEQKELILSDSLDGFIQHYPWDKHARLILVRLYYLDKDTSEVQICMPHILSDDICENILFSELSRFYMLPEGQVDKVSYPVQYKDYALHQQARFDRNLAKNITFWQDYLKDAELFEFPINKILNATEMEMIPYSSYVTFPKEILPLLVKKCARFQINLTDLLCAAIVLTLKKLFYKQFNQNLLINIVKSTREIEHFDNLIGCFVRLDLLKIDVSEEINLIGLAKKIQSKRIEIEQYQACPGMVKLACLANKYWQNKSLLKTIIDIFVSVYTKLCYPINLNAVILSMYTRLFVLRKKQRFLIVLNVLNNLVMPDKKPKKLFGFTINNLKRHHYDVSNINNLLDITLLKEQIDQNYLIVSSNLKPSLREELGNEIIRQLLDESV